MKYTVAQVTALLNNLKVKTPAVKEEKVNTPVLRNEGLEGLLKRCIGKTIRIQKYITKDGNASARTVNVSEIKFSQASNGWYAYDGKAFKSYLLLSMKGKVAVKQQEGWVTYKICK